MNIKHLQGKYVNGTLGMDEMKVFLRYLEENQDAAFRQDRITNLKRKIHDFEQSLVIKEAQEKEQRSAAVEYKNLTEKWENAGAYWKPLGKVITKWYYNGECFFTWFSGVEAVEHLNNAKLADLKFESLVKSGAA